MSTEEYINPEDSITSPPDLWKFAEGYKRIGEMDKVEVLTCTIHALKRIHFFNNKYHYCQYKIKTTSEDKVEKHREEQQYCEDTMMLFANKLEYLEERAIELGFQIPQEFDDVKRELNKAKQKLKEKENETV